MKTKHVVPPISGIKVGKAEKEKIKYSSHLKVYNETYGGH
jgi:hypothetical protein